MNEPTTIHIPPNSELARLLERTGKAPLVLEKDGVRYRLVKEADEIDYDGEKVKATILKVAGTWSDIDTDAIIAGIYHARETGSRPVTRP
jgi:hypothetical protein